MEFLDGQTLDQMIQIAEARKRVDETLPAFKRAAICDALLYLHAVTASSTATRLQNIMLCSDWFAAHRDLRHRWLPPRPSASRSAAFSPTLGINAGLHGVSRWQVKGQRGDESGTGYLGESSARPGTK